MKPESHRIYVAGCKCRGCTAKREDYEAERRRVVDRIDAIAEKGRPLFLSDVAALLPTLPEWS